MRRGDVFNEAETNIIPSNTLMKKLFMRVWCGGCVGDYASGIAPTRVGERR